MGYFGDPNQFQWYLGLHQFIVTCSVNYPAGLNMMANTSLLAEQALFGWLAHFFNMVVVYNIVMYSNDVLAMMFFYYLGTLLLKNKSLSYIGAFISLILPYLTAQNTLHIHMSIVYPVYGLLYFAVKSLQSGKLQRWESVAIWLLLVIEFYTSLEITATLALFSVLMMGLLLLFYRERLIHWWQQNSKLLIAVTVGFLLVVAPGIVCYLFGPDHFTGLTHGTAAWSVYVTDVMNFIVPTPLYLVHSHLTDLLASSFLGNFSEQDGYLGIVAILLVIWSIRSLWHQKYIKIATIMLVVFAWLSLGDTITIVGHSTGILGLWKLVEYYPILNAALPGRLALYVDILVIVIVLLAVDHSLSAQTTTNVWWHPIRQYTMIAVLVITWWPATVSSKMPAVEFQLQQDHRINRLIHHQPVFVITPFFPEMLFALANDHDSFPVANSYGAVPSNPSGSTTFTTALLNPPPSIHTAHARYRYDVQQLTYYLPHMASENIRDVMYFPTLAETIDPSMYRATNAVLGAPVYQRNGIIIWPLHLTHRA
jgi:hypothetical protein